MTPREPVASILEAAMKVSVVAAEALVEVATSFTCDEADAIHDLLLATGAENEAAAFITAHASGDEEGDAHYRQPNRRQNGDTA